MPVVDSLYRHTTTLEDSATLAQLSWQELFSDPNLQKLIETGLANNSDLNIARLRVQEAEQVQEGGARYRVDDRRVPCRLVHRAARLLPCDGRMGSHSRLLRREVVRADSDRGNRCRVACRGKGAGRGNTLQFSFQYPCGGESDL